MRRSVMSVCPCVCVSCWSLYVVVYLPTTHRLLHYRHWPGIQYRTVNLLFMHDASNPAGHSTLRAFSTGWWSVVDR